ncbi:MAG: hypothetical protein ACXAC7_12555 [Candidatus Hodarchaeales archaeon]|jgi:hypothetical protein
MKTNYLTSRKLRKNIQIKHIIPIVLLLVIMLSIPIIIGLYKDMNTETIDPKYVNEEPDPGDAQRTPEIFQEGFNEIPIFNFQEEILYYLITLIGLIFMLFYIFAVLIQPKTMVEFYQNMNLDEKYNPKNLDKKIALELPFGILELFWVKTIGFPKNWEIEMSLKPKMSKDDNTYLEEFAQLLLLKKDSRNESKHYFKSFKAYKWPHIEYLLNYWIKDY